MRVVFLVNRPAELVPTQTTAMMIERAVARWSSVHVCGVAQLSLSRDDRLLARCHSLARDPSTSAARLCLRLKSADNEIVDMTEIDMLLMRTNPARDAERASLHRTALSFGELAAERGVTVVNQPQGLARAGSKLYLGCVPPDLRPPSLVSCDASDILAFVREQDGACVIKPLFGTRGSDVFLLRPSDRNLKQILQVLLRGGYVMVQPFLPEGEAGDVRVVVLDGEILEIGDHVAAIRRVPPADDFRSNLHAGGVAEPVDVTASMRNAATRVGARLRQDGLTLAGLDFVGDKVIEVNVFSPGGLYRAEEFSGARFTDRILDTFESKREAEGRR